MPYPAAIHAAHDQDGHGGVTPYDKGAAMPIRQPEQVEARIAGIPLSIKGLNMVVFLALVATTSYTIYYLTDIVSKEHRLIADSINTQTKAVERLTDVQEEQNCILLADERETEKIRKGYRWSTNICRNMMTEVHR